MQMNRHQLRSCLETELDDWVKLSFDELKTKLKDDEYVYERVEKPNSYQVEVGLLESKPEYVHVFVAVDDGRWSAFHPVSTSFLVYRDGRVDRPNAIK